MSARVLVVDDDFQVGVSIRRALRGHEVQHASSGAQVLILMIAGARFDLIFLDIWLADMTGPQVAESLSRLAPDQLRRLVYITGGDATKIRRECPQIPVLEKPFDVATLHAILGARAA